MASGERSGFGLGLTRRKARTPAAPEVEQFLGAGLHNSLYAAEVFTLVGDHTRGLAFLKRAADQGLGCYPLVATHSRTLAPLRSAPGFPPVLAAIESTWRARA